MRWLSLTICLLLSQIQALNAQDAIRFSGSARVLMDTSSVNVARNGDVTLSLGLSQAVPYRVFTLDNPMRIVLDFREIDWRGFNPAQIVPTGGIAITRMRFGTLVGGWSRLVLDLDAPLRIETADMQVEPETGAGRLRLFLRPSDAENFAKASNNAVITEQPMTSDDTQATTRVGRKKIVLDAGHGGVDPGAIADGLQESHLMLLLVKQVREELLRLAPYDIILTRDQDEFVSLEERVAIARAKKADLFLSFHADQVTQGAARGTIIYRLSNTASDDASALLAERHDRENQAFGADLLGQDDEIAAILFDLARLTTAPRAQELSEKMINALRAAQLPVNRKPMRRAGFSVLKSPDIPSLLIEVGFLSTPEDLDALSDPIWRRKFAKVIAAAVSEWLASSRARPLASRP